MQRARTPLGVRLSETKFTNFVLRGMGSALVVSDVLKYAQIDDNTQRVTGAFAGKLQPFDVIISANGQPVNSVRFSRFHMPCKASCANTFLRSCQCRMLTHTHKCCRFENFSACAVVAHV